MLFAQRIERRLARAERWRRLARLLRSTAVLGIVAAGLILLVGLLANGGLVPAMWLAATAYGLIAIGVTLTWLVLAIVAMAAPIRRVHIAAAVEHEHPDLLDRLNTLVYLENHGHAQSPLAQGIARQASLVLAGPAQRFTRELSRSAMPLAVLLLSLLLTGLFYARFQPLEQIRAAERAAAAAAKNHTPMLAIPSEQQFNAPPQPDEDLWAEVRISEPGRDVRATRWDLVPVRIEALASLPIDVAAWSVERMGEPPQERSLPASSDPNYAEYSEQLDLVELAAEDWDLFCYEARIETQRALAHSDVYFIEVLPLREELEQLPGGQQGVAYEWLDGLSELVARQQNVMRQVMRSDRLTDANAAAAARRGLARELRWLAARHRQLSQEMSNRLPDAAAAEQLRGQFEPVTQALEQAADVMSSPEPGVARDETRRALAELIRARKMLDQQIEQQPEMFAAQPQQLAEMLPAEDWEQWLDASRELPEVAERQQQLAQRARRAEAAAASGDREAAERSAAELAEQQQQLADRLEELLADAPQLQQLDAEGWQRAAQQQRRAAEAFQDARPEASQLADDAARQLARLTAPLSQAEQRLGQRAERQLAAELEAQIEQLKQFEQQPGEVPGPQRQAAAETTQRLTEQLGRLVDQAPARHERLGRALNTEARQQLGRASQQLQRADDPTSIQSAAAASREPLERAAEALAADQTRELAQQVAQDSQTLQQQRSTLDQARQNVKQMLAEQRDLQRDAAAQRGPPPQQQAERQEQLGQRFEQFLQRFADMVKAHGPAREAVAEHLQRSASAQRAEQPGAGQAAEAAAQSLQQLDDQLEQRQAAQHAAEAQQLQQLVGQTNQQLESVTQRPQRYGPPQRGEVATAARTLIDHLAEFTGREDVQRQLAAQGSRGPSEQQRRELADAAQQLEEASDGQQQREAARQVQRTLGETAQQLGGQQPGASQSRSGSALRDAGPAAVTRGLRQLQGLAQRQQSGQPLGPRESQQLREDAADQIVEGLSGEYGQNTASQPLLGRIERDLREPQEAVDLQVIEQLIREVQTQQFVPPTPADPDQPPSDISNIDAGKLPPAYRRPIETYFQKLSESP